MTSPNARELAEEIVRRCVCRSTTQILSIEKIEKIRYALVDQIELLLRDTVELAIKEKVEELFDGEDSVVANIHHEAYARGRDEALERAAALCETHDQVTSTASGKRWLQKKSSNNVNGNAYAAGIRALVQKEGK